MFRFARNLVIAIVALTITAAGAKAAAHALVSGSVGPRTSTFEWVNVGESEIAVIVQGDGTDIDCRLYFNGVRVSSDFRYSGRCVLDASNTTGWHQVEIINQGYRTNWFSIFTYTP